LPADKTQALALLVLCGFCICMRSVSPQHNIDVIVISRFSQAYPQLHPQFSLAVATKTEAHCRAMELELGSPRDSPPIAGPKQGRSRITNGTRFLHNVDGRSPWVRRCKDIIASHLSDLGGVDNASAAERSIIRRASVLTVELEHLEGKFALAGEASPDEID